MLYSPLTHGSVGILDELLPYCLPLAVTVIIITIASRRARKQQSPRERTDKNAKSSTENKTSADDS
jgi:ribosomal protein S26